MTETWVRATARTGETIYFCLGPGATMVRMQDNGGWFTVVYTGQVSVVANPNFDTSQPTTDQNPAILVYKDNYACIDLPENLLPEDHPNWQPRVTENEENLNGNLAGKSPPGSVKGRVQKDLRGHRSKDRDGRRSRKGKKTVQRGC